MWPGESLKDGKETLLNLTRCAKGSFNGKQQHSLIKGAKGEDPLELCYLRKRLNSLFKIL